MDVSTADWVGFTFDQVEFFFIVAVGLIVARTTNRVRDRTEALELRARVLETEVAELRAALHKNA